MKFTSRQFWQTFIVMSVALSALAIYQTEQQTQALLKIRFRYKWVVVMGIFAINIGIGLFLLLRDKKQEPDWSRLDFAPGNSLWKILGFILMVAAFPVLWYAKFDFFGKAVPSFFPLMWVWIWLVLAQSAGLKMLVRLSWPVSFALAVLAGGIFFQSYFALQPVTTYPFSLGWSEASRFYYGSLPFSESVYGQSLPLSVWHGTRYFLLSIPFLFGIPSLWVARLWQAVLWIGLNALTAFVLVRRLTLDSVARDGIPHDLNLAGYPFDPSTSFPEEHLDFAGQRFAQDSHPALLKLIFGGWFFLFLFQGAVYYHLLVCVILVLAGFSSRHLTRSLVVIGIASFWAGMSRLNWYPVPAMLAIELYLLEEPFSTSGNAWRYLFKPILYGAVGLILALAGQAIYIAISGNNDLSAFGSSFTSALLWYRWWPSDTNPLGITPGVLLISAPLLAILFWVLRGQWHTVHPLRWFGLASMLVVLLVGGLIVSTKIGGGGDLHNMDAYIVLLGLIGAYFMSQRVAMEGTGSASFHAVTWPLVALMLIVPFGFSLSRITPPIQYDRARAASDLNMLRNAVQAYGQDGPVLFIYERHLLTFKMIPNIPIVPDYEVVTLTEMAISGNQPYLQKFYDDLSEHRFAAIVARKQNLDAASREFAEESETWNRLVAYHLLCEYEPVLTLESSNIQVFVPLSIPQCPAKSQYSSGEPVE